MGTCNYLLAAIILFYYFDIAKVANQSYYICICCKAYALFYVCLLLNVLFTFVFKLEWIMVCVDVWLIVMVLIGCLSVCEDSHIYILLYVQRGSRLQR